jgi:Mg/Co/Ni transporter MgtE
VAGKQDWLAHGRPVEGSWCETPHAVDRIEQDVPTCRLTETVGAVRARLAEDPGDVCVVVNEQRVVLGLLCERDVGADSDARVEDVMEPGPSTFRPSVPLKEMQQYFAKHDLSSAPITTSDGVLLGLLRRL